MLALVGARAIIETSSAGAAEGSRESGLSSAGKPEKVMRCKRKMNGFRLTDGRVDETCDLAERADGVVRVAKEQYDVPQPISRGRDGGSEMSRMSRIQSIRNARHVHDAKV